MVLLPEGRAINNPDTIKMMKIMPSNLSGKQLFVVSIKLDDDSELMIKNCSSEDEAIELADHCTDLINAAEDGDADSDDDSDSDAASEDESSEDSADDSDDDSDDSDDNDDDSEDSSSDWDSE